ncbi:MAG: NUDIX domain-containing protein [Chloroflexi bacterium]|nr:NUDIX domain-containing protein [Chloroflexota bacterium]
MLSDERKPTPRPSARVVLLDEAGRILLLRGVDPKVDAPSLWITPGGAPEDGENYEQAALRELSEETGLTGVDLGPWIWARRHVWRWGEQWFDSIERYFLVRTSTFTASKAGLAPHELDVITDYRWWTVAEIDAAHDQIFVPRRLGELLRDLLETGPPAEPIDAGV